MTLKLSLLIFALAISVLVFYASSSSSSFVQAQPSGSQSKEMEVDDEAILPGEQVYVEKKEFSNILVRNPEHEEDPPSQDADSGMSPHEAMRCHVCRHAMKPALVKAITEQAGKIDSKELVDTVLRKLAHMHVYDMESKSMILREVPAEKAYTDLERDENIHHFIEHLLWDEHMACSLYALADVYVQQPRRRHWFARLVDHAICPCHNGKEIMRLDHGIDKYLMNHVAATMSAMKRYEMGHELFDNTAPPVRSNKVETFYRTDTDRAREKQSTDLGTIWINSDGHLDSRQQQQHTRDHTMATPDSVGQAGHDSWTL